MQRAFPIIAVAALLAASTSVSDAAEVKILTAGAMKAVVLELVPAFEKETGHKAVVDNDTAGGLSKRILGGEAFDLVVVTPGVIDDLTGKGKVAAGTRAIVARVGVSSARCLPPNPSPISILRRAVRADRSWSACSRSSASQPR
jgi:molybdate transport system substrate-binding protein